MLIASLILLALGVVLLGFTAAGVRLVRNSRPRRYSFSQTFRYIMLGLYLPYFDPWWKISQRARWLGMAAFTCLFVSLIGLYALAILG